MKFASLDLPNPFLIASGPATATIAQLEQAAACGAAGVSIKHAMSRQQKAGQLRCYSEPEGVLIFPSDRRLDVDEAADLVRLARERTDLVLMVNFSSQENDLSSYGRFARIYEQAGAHAVEINMCCPNFGLGDDRPDLAHLEPGALTGQSPDLAAAVVETVRQAVSIPVVAKLTPTAPDLAEVARRCERAGADALSLVGGPSLAAPPVNIRDGGRPVYPLMGKSAFGAITGSAIRYNTFRVVAQVAQVVSIPITASGGIDTWEHAVQMMMWGAASVGVCTAVMWRGFEAVQKMKAGMDRFIAEQGYGGYEEIVGLSLKYLGDSSEMEFLEGHAVVDPLLCRDCGICLKPAHCDAVSRTNGAAIVDPQLCVGCGICATLCPHDAIEMKIRVP